MNDAHLALLKLLLVLHGLQLVEKLMVVPPYDHTDPLLNELDSSMLERLPATLVYLHLHFRRFLLNMPFAAIIELIPERSYPGQEGVGSVPVVERVI